MNKMIWYDHVMQKEGKSAAENPTPSGIFHPRITKALNQWLLGGQKITCSTKLGIMKPIWVKYEFAPAMAPRRFFELQSIINLLKVYFKIRIFYNPR
jgi:hypothetical protein